MRRWSPASAVIHLPSSAVCPFEGIDDLEEDRRGLLDLVREESPDAIGHLAQQAVTDDVGLLTGTAWTFIHEALRPTYPGTAVGERLLLGGFLLITLATSLGAARLAGERAALPEAAVLD